MTPTIVPSLPTKENLSPTTDSLPMSLATSSLTMKEFDLASEGNSLEKLRPSAISIFKVSMKSKSTALIPIRTSWFGSFPSQSAPPAFPKLNPGSWYARVTPRIFGFLFSSVFRTSKDFLISALTGMNRRCSLSHPRCAFLI